MSLPPLKGQGGTWVRVYLSTRAGDSTLGSMGSLYWRDVMMYFLPDVDEEIHLLWDAEENESGVTHPVKRRYWEHDGTAALELTRMIIDPNEVNQRFLGGGYETAWWTERDGDLDALLRASGWKEYGDE